MLVQFVIDVISKTVNMYLFIW